MIINPIVNIVVLKINLTTEKTSQKPIKKKMVKHKMNNKSGSNDVNAINKGRENTRGKNLGRTHENGPKQKKAWLMNHPNTRLQENG